VTIDEELEVWWESLSDDVRAAVLRADVDDLPGWIIASAVAAHIGGPAHSSTDPPDTFAVQVHEALARFIVRKRGE
jgi:hypothetical protein